MSHLIIEMRRASEFLYSGFHEPFRHCLTTHHTLTAFMESVWTLHSTLVRASLWLFLMASFAPLLLVFSDVPKSVNEEKKPHLQRSNMSTSERLGVLGDEGSGSPQCVRLSESEPLALQSAGDVIIGGFFPLHFVASEPQQGYQSQPQLTPCSG